jgi:hypothetical protein
MVYPLFMIGSYIGIILYIAMSELMIAILVISIMTILSIHMIFTSVSKFKAETVKFQKEEQEALAKANYQSQTPAAINNDDGDGDEKEATIISNELKEILDREKNVWT